MRNHAWRHSAAVLACLLVYLAQGQSPAGAGYSARVRPLLPPDGGAYFGVASDIKTIGVKAYAKQLGEAPASFVIFCDVPFASGVSLASQADAAAVLSPSRTALHLLRASNQQSVQTDNKVHLTLLPICHHIRTRRSSTASCRRSQLPRHLLCSLWSRTTVCKQ